MVPSSFIHRPAFVPVLQTNRPQHPAGGICLPPAALFPPSSEQQSNEHSRPRKVGVQAEEKIISRGLGIL